MGKLISTTSLVESVVLFIWIFRASFCYFLTMDVADQTTGVNKVKDPVGERVQKLFQDFLERCRFVDEEPKYLKEACNHPGESPSDSSSLLSDCQKPLPGCTARMKLLPNTSKKRSGFSTNRSFELSNPTSSRKAKRSRSATLMKMRWKRTPRTCLLPTTPSTAMLTATSTATPRSRRRKRRRN